MDSIRLAPSEQFRDVLKELHTIPGAPKPIFNFFNLNKDIKEKEKDRTSDNEVKESNELDSEEKLGTKIENLAEENKSNDKVIFDADLPAEADHFNSSELLLSTNDVKWCHEQIKKRGIKFRIHELINDSEIIYPKVAVRERNPDLEERINKLRAQQENREYQNMTSNLRFQTGNQAAFSGIGREIREMHSEVNRQLIAGVQYIVSIVGTFFALYVGASFYDSELSTRIVVSLIGAVIVGIAEIYFIIREDLRSEAEQKKKI